ncbi:MAG: FemAB family PEP-CTERM system-associated protein [Bdellovibrionales bacterium]|nr:FemAB family PEP-CTERM system-associated protein [Bdellovibrionales bacterium]
MTESRRITVTAVAEAERAVWEAFLQHLPADHHAFHWHWREILRRTFGHQPHYLLARTPDGTACGVLPLFHVKSMLFGAALISVPYLNGGGIHAETDAAFAALEQAAAALGQELRVDYVELRHRKPAPEFDGEPALEGKLVERSHKVSMLLPLDADPEALFASFRPKLRSQIRRPSKSGIVARVGADGDPYLNPLDAFFTVFSEHMRDLGTPVFPKRLFHLSHEAFGPACRIITVWLEQTPVAAGITVGHGTATEMLWAASLRRYSAMAPNMLLYWEAMKTAIQDGYRIFDFGRSSYGSGPHRFKMQWGASELPLHWHYRLLEGDIPDINPENPRFTTMVRCWQRLPLPLANTLGPWITKSLP